MQGEGDYVYNHKDAINQILRADYEKKKRPPFFFSTKHTKKLKERDFLKQIGNSKNPIVMQL